MSKFTKALEKIQDTRLGKSESESIKSFPEHQMGDEISMKEASWERGITVIRNTNPDKRIVKYHFPNSVIAEQYRSLRTNLKTRMAKEEAKVIAISSSINGEGKTITSLNLAFSFAEAGGCKVAIVDADLRRGRISHYLGLGRDLPGLTEFLQNPELTVKDVMVRNSVENLYIVPRGKVADHPAELIDSVKFRSMIKELRRHFDYIIIDTPPIMSVADAAVFGAEADGLVMVIQSGRTPKTVIAHAHELFRQAGLNLMGYVLTNVEFQSADYRYYSYNYYGETEQNEGVKSKAGVMMKKMGLNFERTEEKFSDWWKHRSKNKKQRPKPELIEK